VVLAIYAFPLLADHRSIYARGVVVVKAESTCVGGRLQFAVGVGIPILRLQVELLEHVVDLAVEEEASECQPVCALTVEN